MKFLIVATILLQESLGSYVSVNMPYVNPAGVTYINSEYQQDVPLDYNHIGYAKTQHPAVAAVPYIHHIPTVSHIPVTRYEAQPAVIEKQLDVAKAAISTQKFEVRRPAIQKHFYDIEERVIVRPVGSAVVELDEPTSKIQKGKPVIETLSEINSLPSGAHNLIAHAPTFGQSPSAPSAIPFIAHAPVHVTVAPVISHAPVSHVQHLQPISKPVSSDSSSSSDATSSNHDESVVVDNADFRRAQSQGDMYENTRTSQQQEQQFLQNLKKSQSDADSPLTRNVVIESNGADSSSRRFIAHDPTPSTLQTLARSHLTQEETISNQRRLIDLLTARGGVTEVGFGHGGATSSLIGDAGQIRARVISATAAPDYATGDAPDDERVSTRRVVVSRPIETLEEINVSEPHTKFERISVQHPTYIHSQHLDHIQVHGSVPVVGKVLTPAIAHASVPVYQKTLYAK